MDKFMLDVAAESGVPINIIQMIIAFIMQLIAGCTPVPTPAEIKTGGWQWNIAIYRGMIAAGVRMRGAQGSAIMAAMQKHAALATDEDAVSFLSAAGVQPPA